VDLSDTIPVIKVTSSEVALECLLHYSECAAIQTDPRLEAVE